MAKKEVNNVDQTRSFSSQVVDGMERAPSRGMLYAVGFGKK